MASADSTQLAQVAQTDAERQLVEQFTQMVTGLPEIPSDGGLGILANILRAQTLEELDAVWTDKGEDWAEGREFVFESLAIGESDFTSGIGYFMLVTATDVASGEQIKFSTGSINVMGQLAAAHYKGLLPLAGTIVRNERATRAGYHPQHIKVSRDQTAAQMLTV